MQLPPGTFQPQTWTLAKVDGKKVQAWEASWQRFQSGDKLQAIALTQTSGKPIQPSTVLGHLLTALTHGRALDLSELVQQAAVLGCAPPTRGEWEQLSEAAAAATIDVVKKEKVVHAELLNGFLPQAAKPVAQRTESDKAILGVWYPRVAWYIALRRIALDPSFA